MDLLSPKSHGLLPCPDPRALDLLRRSLAFAWRSRRFPSFVELWGTRGIEVDAIAELAGSGLLLALRPPSPPYGEVARATLVPTRDGVRVAMGDHAAAALALVVDVRDAIAARLRRGGEGWWTLEELALAVGRPAAHVAVALVLLIADATSPNVRQLDPYHGCPPEFWVDFDLATATVDPNAAVAEFSTPHAAMSAGMSPAHAEGTAKGRLPSVEKRVRALLEVWDQERSLDRFATQKELIDALHGLVNAVDGQSIQPGDKRFRQRDSVRIQVEIWQRERREAAGGGHGEPDKS